MPRILHFPFRLLTPSRDLIERHQQGHCHSHLLWPLASPFTSLASDGRRSGLRVFGNDYETPDGTGFGIIWEISAQAVLEMTFYFVGVISSPIVFVFCFALWLWNVKVFGDNAFSLPSSAKKMGYVLMDRDPNNVLQSWDPTLVNPCTWFHVTCNNDNNVIRVDLGNAALSGQLVPQLGQLKNLKELYSNNISGPIPNDLGNLTNLVSLDLYLNRFSGPIPESLGKLSKLRFLIETESLGILVPGLIHFLLLLLAQSLAISSGHSTQESEKILQLEQQVRQSREEAHQSREEARQSREQNERLQRQFESLFNVVLPLLPSDT
ncbi:hypothetical protein Fmac_026222 [Flemingia macrophylla]|uniref:Leucine-rich repeat-containing N-terminal plant-type domain-containing protein n=1 Tax=Flemingia macrophylla TaxID=520843 RepID=A0ABD1LET1_9FABA